MKAMYQEFKRVFQLENTNKVFKVITNLIFGASYTAIFLTILIATYLNMRFNQLIKYSFVTIGYVLRKVFGIKRVIFLPLLVVTLIPFIFSMYVLIVIFRLLLPILLFVFNLHVIVMTLFNTEPFRSKMDELIKQTQKDDEF